MKSKGHAHIIGVCGTAMAPLAGLLKDDGYDVTGSDANAYPPMSDQLAAIGVEVMKGYDPAHLDPAPDFVVVGNVCRKDNPEAAAAIERGIPYYSMPSLMEERYLAGAHPIVVTGTHGKTTTTSMLAWMLECAGVQPSFLAGGVPLNFGRSYRIGGGRYFVIEGDEYDTAFFDKGPKFLHYRPRTAVITSVEFDHADIYRDFSHYRSSFEKFVSIIPADGDLLAAGGGVIDAIASGARCRVHRYGPEAAGTRFSFADPSFSGTGTEFDFIDSGRNLGTMRMPLPGLHNVYNAVAAIGVCILIGITPEKAREGLGTFLGVARRQQLRGNPGGVTVVDDFAHHPTAVAETVDAVRKKHVRDGCRLITVFEPRSNTSRRNFFQDRYATAFNGADLALVATPFGAESLKDGERLDTEKLAGSISATGVRAEAMRDTASIISRVVAEARRGDTVLVMSNGAFDNLVERLLKALGEREGGRFR